MRINATGRMPKLGDEKTFVPSAFEAGLPVDISREVTGRVVWIHPQGRYYVVLVDRGANSWRETFYCD